MTITLILVGLVLVNGLMRTRGRGLAHWGIRVLCVVEAMEQQAISTSLNAFEHYRAGFPDRLERVRKEVAA